MKIEVSASILCSVAPRTDSVFEAPSQNRSCGLEHEATREQDPMNLDENRRAPQSYSLDCNKGAKNYKNVDFTAYLGNLGVSNHIVYGDAYSAEPLHDFAVPTISRLMRA